MSNLTNPTDNLEAAKTVAITGLVAILDNDDPMRDVLNAWQIIRLAIFADLRSNAALSDFIAAAEAKADEMQELLDGMEQ